jgi:hypothetical protein
MATKIAALGGYAPGTARGGEFIMGEKSPINGCASGDEPWYPAFRGGRNEPNVCFKSATERRLGGLATYDCGAKQSKRARLCFCHTERFGRVWRELPGFAKNTGEPLGKIVSGLKLAQCKQKCDNNEECQSISHDASDGTCVLHSKLQSPTAELEGKPDNPGFKTHYVFFGYIPETVLEVPAATGDITRPFRILSDSKTDTNAEVCVYVCVRVCVCVCVCMCVCVCLCVARRQRAGNKADKETPCNHTRRPRQWQQQRARVLGLSTWERPGITSYSRRKVPR